MKNSLIESLSKIFDFVGVRPSHDCEAVNVPQEHLLTFCKYLRDDLAFDMLVDLTAIDAGLNSSTRFTVIYHFFTTLRHEYFRVACECVCNQHPAMVSIVSLWPAANWHEREAYDMFGVEFKGHPDLKRILMWEGYPYYPLRKDFPLAGVETNFPAADVVEEVDVKLVAAPMMGGPFHARQASTMKLREPMGYDESWTEKHQKPL